MKRRDFFRLGAQKTARIAYELASEKVGRAGRWLRPPFALAELEFLLACTRCDRCVEACTYGVLFKLPARLGLQVVGTPAMDLLARGCRMCRDWPCVGACEPGALQLPDGNGSPPEHPKLALVRIDPNACLPYSGPECGACADSCPVSALVWEDARPVIDEERCTGCALCREACIVEPKAVKVSALARDTRTAGAS
jgi:ferredoxin-type protein NapG